jgi:homocysteine S-methyltransferase
MTGTDTAAEGFVTDGGLETDLIFNHGVDLPDFAAFPLLDTRPGRELLTAYYADYAAIAARAGAGLLLETPTWRANPDWAARLGYDVAALDRVNRAAVELMRDVAERWGRDLPAVAVSGQVGPRGDGYRPGAAVDPAEAADYHRPQLASFKAAGADRATALTLTDVGEAIGISRAGAEVGIPVAIAFTVETDGRLPGGVTLAEAVTAVDQASPPAYFVINCAHPTHVERGVDDGAWRDRVRGLRVNASTKSHAELDEAEELDDGDPEQLARDNEALRRSLPALEIVGGCCGTDARHVAAMWGVSHGPRR